MPALYSQMPHPFWRALVGISAIGCAVFCILCIVFFPLLAQSYNILKYLIRVLRKNQQQQQQQQQVSIRYIYFYYDM